MREALLLSRVTGPFIEGDRRLRQRLAAGERVPPFSPLFITRKKQFAPSELASLARLLVTASSGQRFYTERESKEQLKRFHLSDGLVLPHVGPYFSGLPLACLKWKYPELISIDFRVVSRPPYRFFELQVLGPSPPGAAPALLTVRSEPNLVENMDAFARALVRERGAPPADPLACLAPGAEPVIAELSYNKRSGRWVFHCLRRKRLPNFVTVAFQTMEQIMDEPITIKELIEIAAAGSANHKVK